MPSKPSPPRGPELLLAAGSPTHLIDLALHHGLHGRVFDHLSQHSPVAAADDQHLAEERADTTRAVSGAGSGSPSCAARSRAEREPRGPESGAEPGPTSLPGPAEPRSAPFSPAGPGPALRTPAGGTPGWAPGTTHLAGVGVAAEGQVGDHFLVGELVALRALDHPVQDQDVAVRGAGQSGEAGLEPAWGRAPPPPLRAARPQRVALSGPAIHPPPRAALPHLRKTRISW